MKIISTDLKYPILDIQKVTGTNKDGQVDFEPRYSDSFLKINIEFNFTEQQITFKYFDLFDMIC